MLNKLEKFPFPITAQREFLERKTVSFYEKFVLKKFSNEKTTNKIFSKTFPRGIKC